MLRLPLMMPSCSICNSCWMDRLSLAARRAPVVDDDTTVTAHSVVPSFAAENTKFFRR